MYIISFFVNCDLLSVTIISAILMFILFISELNYYLTKEIHPELFVDTTKGQKLRINMDLKFAHIGCSCKNLLVVYVQSLPHDQC